MRQEWRAIPGLDHATARFGGGHVTLLIKHVAPGVPDRGFEFGLDSVTVQRAQGPLLPLHCHGERCLARMPSRPCHHGKARSRSGIGRQHHDPLNTRHRKDGISVDTAGRAAQHGAQSNHGIAHSRQSDIKSEPGRAVDLGRNVGPR